MQYSAHIHQTCQTCQTCQTYQTSKAEISSTVLHRSRWRWKALCPGTPGTRDNPTTRQAVASVAIGYHQMSSNHIKSKKILKRIYRNLLVMGMEKKWTYFPASWLGPAFHFQQQYGQQMVIIGDPTVLCRGMPFHKASVQTSHITRHLSTLMASKFIFVPGRYKWQSSHCCRPFRGLFVHYLPNVTGRNVKRQTSLGVLLWIIVNNC